MLTNETLIYLGVVDKVYKSYYFEVYSLENAMIKTIYF